MNPFLEQTLAFLKRLSIGQRIALASVGIGALVILSLIGMWTSRPDYALLFGGLEPDTAGEIIQLLQSDQVNYELRETNSGTSVFVPRDQRDELRLRFASQGVISNGPESYDDLFGEGATFGRSSSEMELAKQRALQGELARTIASIRQVESARVHLVIPDRSPFAQTQAEATASVFLQLTGSGALSPNQIDGITSLVAAGVEGLDPSNVTVVDTRGNLLSNPHAGNEAVALSMSQMQLQQELEQSLLIKAQSMLDDVYGPNNAIVRLNATLNFSTQRVVDNMVDPESQTVISQERLDLQTDEQTENAVVTNNTVSTRNTTTETPAGEIKFLTVTVMLNQRSRIVIDDDGVETVEYIAYTQDQIRMAEDAVRNAVGFNEDRGDTFSISQMPFDTSISDEMQREVSLQRQNEQIEQYVRMGLMVLALLLAMWLIRSASRRATELALPTDIEVEAEPEEDPLQLEEPLELEDDPLLLEAPEEEDFEFDLDIYTSKLSLEARRRMAARSKLFEYIKEQVAEHPHSAVDLIRSWLAEDLANGKLN